MSTASPTRRESLFRWSVVGLAAVITFAWMIAGALDAPTIPENYTNGYSHSPGGHSALIKLLRDDGRDVQMQVAAPRLPEFNSWNGATLALLEPRIWFVDEYRTELRAMFREAFEGECSVVLVLPKRRYSYARNEGDGTEVIYEQLASREEINDLMELAGLDQILEVSRHDWPVEVYGELEGRSAEYQVQNPVQTLGFLNDRNRLGHGREPEVLIETRDGQAVAVRLFPAHTDNRGGIVVVSEPDLLSNRFIGEGAAALGLSVFQNTPPDGPILIDEALHGFAATASLEYLALSPPGLWLTLSVLALMALFAWREATIVRPLESIPSPQRARIFAVEGVARMMRRAADHKAAYRQLVRRAQLVIGGGPVSVLADHGQAPAAQTEVVNTRPGPEDLQNLVDAAAQVAQMMNKGGRGAGQAPGKENS